MDAGPDRGGAGRGRARPAGARTATLLAGARDRRAETEAILAERRSLLEKARQAERLIAERDAAQERYERYRQAVEVTARARRSWRPPIPRPTRCRSSAPASSACARWTSALRELRAALAGEVDVQFEVAPEPTTWRSLSRVSVALISSAS